MAYATSFVALWAERKELKKNKFLGEMQKAMPWDELRNVIAPYHNWKWGGRPKMEGMLLLKMYCLQQWFGLSDPGVEEEIYDRISFQKFLNIDLLNDIIPDETTLLRFRHLLEEHKLQEKLFEKINEVLEKKGLIMRKWTLVDATIINAPSSTKNEKKERDPDMASTKKGNQYYFGMKAHIWVDGTTWVVHTVKCTKASIFDWNETENLLHGKEEYVSGDKVYWKQERKREFREKGIIYWILDKAPRWKKLSVKQEKRNRKRQSLKSKVEHVFQVCKCQRNYRKTRYRWILKNWMQVTFIMWLVNIYKMRRYLLT